MSLPIKRRLVSEETIDQTSSNPKEDEEEEEEEENASTSRRREEITLATRLQIIREMEEGVPVDKLAAEYGLNKRTIQRYRKNIDSIRESSKNPRYLVMKRNRVPMHEDINARLIKWILERQTEGEVFTDSVIQEKAKELHKTYGGSACFTASRGWLWRFKKRYNVTASGIHETKQEASKITPEKLAKILGEETVDLDNMYNVQETCLTWRTLPESLLANGKLLQGEKVKKEFVTVAFCTNATGTHKLPLLLVNKHASPRALKHCRHMLPVVYTSQSNSCIDETVFNVWYSNFFKWSVRQHREHKQHTGKVVLLVDNYIGDMFFEKMQEDPYFKVVALPFDSSSLVQPMDEGIITKCKKLFRQKLLRQVHQYEDVKKFYANYDIKDCIDLISEAWNEITMMDIIHSWSKISNLLGQPNFEIIIIKEEPEQLEDSGAPQETLEWISKCEEEESTIKEALEEEETALDTRCPIEKEEIDRMFYDLELWAGKQPDYINLYAKALRRHHYGHQ